MCEYRGKTLLFLRRPSQISFHLPTGRVSLCWVEQPHHPTGLKKWSDERGKEYCCCLLKEMKEQLKSSHPWKERKIELTLWSVNRRWRWYVWKLHAFIYGWLIGQRHCFVHFSLTLCSVGHRVNGENSSGGWGWYSNEWTENVRLSIFSILLLETMSPFFVPLVWQYTEMVDWFEYSSQNGLPTKIYTIAVWFKSREIIYKSRFFSTMISIFPHWSITINIDIMRRRYHNLFDYCLCYLSIERVWKNEEGI